jgi:hypothetical protein
MNQEEKNSVLNTIFPDCSSVDENAAFVASVSWRERAKRILMLVKHLRHNGDVWVVSRRAMCPDDLWFFVTAQKSRPADEAPRQVACRIRLVTKGNSGETKIRVVTVMLSRHEPPPRLVTFGGKVYARSPYLGSHAYTIDLSVPEAVNNDGYLETTE